ncbi:MAG: TniQ family protein [Paracoccaceae bacterium]
MSALLIAFDLLPRETATSYMSRLASANGMDAATLGRETGINFSDVINGDSSALAGLAVLGATDLEQLAAWSYLHQDSRHSLFRGETFLGKAVKNPQVRGCTA